MTERLSDKELAALDETATIRTYCCPEHGKRTSVMGEYTASTGQVDNCAACSVAFRAVLAEERLQEAIRAVRSDIEFGNTDPDWIGERPGVFTEEEILAAARDQIEGEEAEFARGWDQYKIDRETEMSS